ncbi:C4b-binding protein alpha chain [Erethizon dorsatum]
MTLVTSLLATVLGECGPPPRLSFASSTTELNQTEFQTGTVLKYTCRPGYIRISSAQTLTCKVNGQWQYEAFCGISEGNQMEESLGLVKSPKTGVLHREFLLDGSKTGICESEAGFNLEIMKVSAQYNLVGPTTSVCEIRDKGVDWSAPFPVCEIVKCESPPDISNGKHSGRDEDLYTYGSSVTYVCDPSYSLLGNPSISCMVVNKTAGVWSPSPPTCKKIICHLPTVPHATIVSGFRPIYTFKDSVMFSCQKGFNLRGSSLIRCEADNNWNPSPPACEPTQCLKPEIENGNLSVNKPQYIESENVTIHCDSGFEVKGFPSITCSENRTWYPEVPKCEWEVPEVCEQVVIGRKLIRCLSSPAEVQMALQLYKLSLEIELLQLQIDKARQSAQGP